MTEQLRDPEQGDVPQLGGHLRRSRPRGRARADGAARPGSRPGCGPAARIRKTRPNFSSYARLPAARARGQLGIVRGAGGLLGPGERLRGALTLRLLADPGVVGEGLVDLVGAERRGGRPRPPRTARAAIERGRAGHLVDPAGHGQAGGQSLPQFLIGQVQRRCVIGALLRARPSGYRRPRPPRATPRSRPRPLGSSRGIFGADHHRRPARGVQRRPAGGELSADPGLGRGQERVAKRVDRLVRRPATSWSGPDWCSTGSCPRSRSTWPTCPKGPVIDWTADDIGALADPAGRAHRSARARSAYGSAPRWSPGAGTPTRSRRRSPTSGSPGSARRSPTTSTTRPAGSATGCATSAGTRRTRRRASPPASPGSSSSCRSPARPRSSC